MFNHAKHLCLNHGYASKRTNSALEISFDIGTFLPLLKKTWSVDYSHLFIFQVLIHDDLGSSILVVHLDERAQNHRA